MYDENGILFDTSYIGIFTDLSEGVYTCDIDDGSCPLIVSAVTDTVIVINQAPLNPNTLLIGLSDAIPSSCVAPDYPKTTCVTLEKVDPFDTRHHPKFNLNSTTLVKIDFFETSCHHLEIVGQFESRSGAQKKLRSLLQANIPKQVTSSQIRDITVAVKDAIEKATYNL